MARFVDRLKPGRYTLRVHKVGRGGQIEYHVISEMAKTEDGGE